MMPGPSEKNDDSSSRHVDQSYFDDHDVHLFGTDGKEIYGDDAKPYLEDGKPLPEGYFLKDEDDNYYEFDPESEDYVYTGRYGEDGQWYDSEGLNDSGQTEDQMVQDEETGEWIGPDGEPDPDYEPEQHGPSGEEDSVSGDGDSGGGVSGDGDSGGGDEDYSGDKD
jgi:hypothetical protein